MKCASFERASTLDCALKLAHGYGEKAAFVAGATDVLVKAREKDCYADRHMIDISDISSLKEIKIADGRIHIGALATHAQISKDEIIQKHAQVLALACAEVGSPQIRNKGTLGGNIANSSPAADSFAALAVLNATVVIESAAGQHCMPFSEVITGPYKNKLQPEEIITEIIVDCLSEDYRHAFYKVGRRNALAISRLTAAGVLQKDSSGAVKDVRLALGSVFPTPVVFSEITSPVIGKVPSSDDIARIAEKLSEKIPEIAGIRPSTRYKQPVAGNVIERVLTNLLGGPVS